MAFKIGNQTVIQDIDSSAAIETNSDLDKLQINSTDVLVHDGSTITLKNVELDSSIGIDSDSITEGTTNKFYSTALFNTDFATKDTDDLTEGSNLYFTNARVDARIPTNVSSFTNDSGYLTAHQDLSSYALTTQLFSGSYNDLTNTPTIPTNNNQLTNGASYATEAYADTAEADAKAYTDTRETAITTAYETYADQAEVDAKAYTDTRETAITTAYETYANLGDTTTYNASKSYTDTEIATVLPLSGGTLTGALTLNGAPTGSNNAATKAYVDASVSSGTGALDTDDIPEASNLYYTDARVNTLLGTKNYATETYVDTAVANVVDSAPAALDTLNELAAALGDDPNLSTTLSTQIGTKVAKAGDTMTGALTLSGAPSSANHAATKAYVDASVSGGTGGLDTDDITEASNLYYTDARIASWATANLANVAYGSAIGTLDALTDVNVSGTKNVNDFLTWGGSQWQPGTFNRNLNTFDNTSTLFLNAAGVDSHLNQSNPTSGYVLSWNGSDYVWVAQTTNTNTTYTAGTGITLNGTVFSNDITNNNQLTNGAGYITSFTDTNTTYTAGNGLTLTGTEFTMSGSYTGSFTASGDVTAYSDERLKSNITTIEDALDKVKAMRGVMFDKTDSLTSELRQSTGVIAQETEQVLPEVVHNDENTGYKSVAYGNIVGVLIEAIKEQQLQIDELTEQVEFLKGKR